MSIEGRRRAIERHQREMARLQQEKSRETATMVAAIRRSQSAATAASRATTEATARLKLREAQRYGEAAARHQKRVSELDEALAREHRRLSEAQERLRKAQTHEDRRRRKTEEKLNREQERRFSSIARQLTHHEELHRVALGAIERLQRLPNRHFAPLRRAVR